MEAEQIRAMVDEMGGPEEAHRLVSIYMSGRLAGEFEDVIASRQWERTEVSLLYWLADLRERRTPPSYWNWEEAQRRAESQ